MTQKPETTLVVTDSGLGGMSVFAGLVQGLARGSEYSRINLVYVNAWPRQHKGYNHYPDMAARARVFHNALTAMAGFRPDQILIACNTLSVIYPHTQFSAQTLIPVTGIVENGVEMIRQGLDQDPQSRAVIFGTPTTADQATHKKALVDQGIDPSRVVNQGCINLAGKIERDPFGPEVAASIEANAKAAAQKLGPCRGRVFAALCCTHFGYCRDQFQSALHNHTRAQVEILNPNQAMTDQILARQTGGPAGSPPKGGPELALSVYSRVLWEPERISAYEKLLTPVSPKTVAALKAYTLDRNLFSPDA